jgi:hypothetical protein
VRHDVFEHERAHAIAAILLGVPVRGFAFGSTVWDGYDGRMLIQPGVGSAEQLATIAIMPLVMLGDGVNGSAGDIETVRKLKPTDVSDYEWIETVRKRAIELLHDPRLGSAYREATDRLLEAV